MINLLAYDFYDCAEKSAVRAIAGGVCDRRQLLIARGRAGLDRPSVGPVMPAR